MRLMHVDFDGTFAPHAGVGRSGTGLLASLGSVGLGVDGHHARGRGRRGLCPFALPLQVDNARVLFGDALARSQENQQ